MNPGDLTTLAHVKEWLGLSGFGIAAITNANPAQVTLASAPQTPLLNGGAYSIDGAMGISGVNAAWTITKIDALNFTIPVDTTLAGAYTGGGLVGVSDPLVARLISAVSTYIQNVINRTVRNQAYAETRSGNGGQALLPLQYPVTSVAALTVDGITIPPRPALGVGSNSNFIGFGWQGGPAGYTFDVNRVMLSGLYCFSRGFANVALSYSAGFLVANEPQTIPGTAPYVLLTLAHWNAGDRGVTYADGTPLSPRAFGASLAVGQYSVDPNGVYYFAAADAGAPVLLSYGYVPFDLEQAAVDMIGDWFKYRDRIGVLSQGIEQQTITFVNAAITARAQGVLNQYRRVAPVAP